MTVSPSLRLAIAAALALFACTSVGSSAPAPVSGSGIVPRATDAPAKAAPDAPSAHLASAATEPTSAKAVASPVPAPIDETVQVLTLNEGHSTSLGSPGGGTLEGAVALPRKGPGFVFNTLRPDIARFGTVELVQAIVRAASEVHAEMPGSGLVVNDLSLEGGGRIKQHASHQNGRDVDILFYMLSADGSPVPAVGVPIDPKGEGIDFRDLSIPDDDLQQRMDVPRTWRFMQALLSVASSHVQRIFIAEHVRNMLLDEARRKKAPVSLRERFEMLTCQPEVPHDDHMHVRFYCSPEDQRKGCMDSPPVYPWRTAALKVLGLRPVVESAEARAKRRSEVAARTTSVAEAKQKAGPMDAAVVRFLAQRDRWAKKPSPGRTYCP